ncbi:EAL domain-containing protein [Catellatospora tritici]|uniref:EAL domain-containing protein n=1 Tax=Catellatospora tritici TaxID=2851566 RepID=UPI001C2DDF69|nr:EAL domain-containing protein [Catellatospora tritici]MBV1848711.1 EAL domain-containing protein [Catellatospora tritici]
MLRGLLPLRVAQVLDAELSRDGGQQRALPHLLPPAGDHDHGVRGLHDVPLFLNVEPETFGVHCPPDLADARHEALRHLDLVIELTERGIKNPAEVFRFVARAREYFGRLALDDVGADPTSLTMMALVRPDVIKLDRSLIQARQETWTRSYVINTALTVAANTGAAVLAEGIETPEHLKVARAMGAHLGQGWLFGKPGPLPATVKLSAVPIPRLAIIPSKARTPFSVVERQTQVSPGNDQMIRTLGRMLEEMALHGSSAAMLFLVVPDGQIDSDCRLMYSHIARHGVPVTAFGPGLPPTPGPGIQGVSLPADDPLFAEHAVIVIGNYFAAALTARTRRHDADVKTELIYDVALTYDRLLVTEAARTLIGRMPRMTHRFGSTI